MPIRAPMVLDHWLRPPGDAKLRWLLPVKRADDATEPRANFAGWFLPGAGVNLVRVVDRTTATGFYRVPHGPDSKAPRVLMTSRHAVGRDSAGLLSTFGGYRMNVTLLPVAGIGPVDHATSHAAVNVERGVRGWSVRVVSATRITGGTLSVAGDRKRYRQTVNAHPHRPEVIDTPIMADQITVTLTSPAGDTLLQATLPAPFADTPTDLDPDPDQPPGPPPDRDRHEHDCEPGPFTPIAHDLAVLRDSEEPGALRASARRVLRVDPDHPLLEEGLKRLLRQRPDDPQGHLYRAIHWLERDRPERAADHLQRATDLPGAAFLLALHHVRAGRMDQADDLFRRVLKVEGASLKQESDDADASSGVFTANYLPAFYHAVLLHGWGRNDEATERLRRLPPHIVEGWMLLEDADRQATFRETDPTGFEQAERWYEAAREARWPGLSGPDRSRSEREE